MLDNGRHIFQARDPDGRSDGKCSKFPGGKEIRGSNRCQEIELVGAIEKIGNTLLRLLIRHMRGTRAGLQLEHLSDEMSGRSKTRG